MLDSLHRRPRGRAIAPMLSRLSGGLVPEGPAMVDRAREAGSGPTDGVRIVVALRAYAVPAYDELLGPPTRDLLERIDAADVVEVQRRLDSDLRAVWDTATPIAREHLKLIFGVHCGVDAILEKTGLLPDVPPDDIHAMGRGPLAAGGDFWLADLVADAAERCGVEFAPGMRVLDFGSSSGRHLRVLQAWRPQVRWMGCDPNAGAIRWADAHLPGIEFFVSPQEPRLELETSSVDVVFAVSVWSHFGAGAAERWLAEMRRIIRPGGLLVFTTQSVGSLAHYLRADRVSDEYAVRVAEALLAGGHSYVEAFGECGDWGVKSPEWGTAYMTLEWLAQRTSPDWSLPLYEAVRIDTNQDLVVLQRA